MRTHPPRPTLVLALACLLAILLFFLDIAVPQAHLWGSYLLPIVLVFLWGRHDTWRRDIYIVTALASILIVATFWTGGVPAGGNLLTSYLLPILLLWAVAWLLAQRRQLQEQLDAQVRSHTAALGASEAQLNKIFRANPGGIAISRLSDGCFLDANPAYLQMLGYTRDELVGRTSVDLGILSAAARAQIVDRLKRGEAAVPFAVPLRTKTGATIDVMTAIDIIDFAGEPCYLSFMVDITAQKQLEARAHQLAALVDAAQDAIMSADLDGTIVTLNQSAEALYGITAGAVVGQNMARLIPPEYIGPLQETLGQLGQGETMTLDDVAWPLPDGSIRSLSIALSPIRDDGGQVTGFASLARDVTARNQMERDLARLAGIVQNSSDVIISTDLDGTVRSMNHAAEQMLGISAGEAKGRHVSLLNPDMPEAERAAVFARLRTGEAFTLPDITLTVREGRRVDLSVTALPLFDNEGQVLGVASIARDITARKAAERERLFLSALVTSSPDAIVGRTVDGTILSWNRGAEQLFGYTAAEAIGQNLTMLAAPGGLAQMQADMAAVAQGQPVEDPATQHMAKDGRVFDCRISLFPVRDNAGEVVGVASFTHDISGRKQLEAELRQSEARFRAMFAEHAAAMLLIDPATGAVVDSNQAASDFYGYTSAELHALKIWDINTRPRAEVQAQMQRACNREWNAFIFSHRLADGTVRDVEVHSSPINTGGSTLLFSIIHDVTARREAEAAQRASEAQLAKIFRTNPGAIVITRQSDGCYLDANPAYLHMLGFTRDELVGRRVVDLGILSAATRAEIVDRFKRGAVNVPFEVPLRTKTGTTIDVMTAIETVDYAGESCYLSFVVDLTERKAAERALARSEQKWRSVFEFLPVGLSVVDTKHHVTDSNPALAQILAMTPEGILQGRYDQRRYFRPDLSPMPPEEFPSVRALREERNVRDVVIGVEKEDGDLIWVNVSATPESIDGYALTLTDDITERKRLEAELLAQVERWNMAAEISSIGIWDWRAGSDAVLWDERMYLLHGVAPGTAMTFAAWRTVIHPDDRAGVEANSRKSGTERTRVPVEYRVVLPDGSLRYLLSIGGGLYDESGTPVRQLGITMDITARKQLEAALRNSEARYRLLVDNAEDVIWMADVDGRFTFVNPAVERQLGYRPEEVIGQRFDRWLTRASAAAAMETLAETVAQLSAGQRPEAAQFEGEQIRKDGTLIFTQTIGVPLLDEAGLSTGFLGITRDVTERKQAEEALAASEHKYRELYDNSPDMYFVGLPAQGLILDCNQTLARTLGYASAELIGGPSHVLFAPATYKLMQAATNELLAAGSYDNFEVQLRRRDGTLLDALMSATIELAPAGGPARARVTLHDITERKRAEVALAESESRLRAVIENTEDCIWSVDGSYCLVIGNSVFDRGVQQQIGRPLAAGECVFDAPFLPTERAFWQPLYDRALAGESLMVEMPAVVPPGGTLACYINPIYAADGAIAGVSGRVTDISALKQVEAQLRASQARYQMLADYSTDVIWTLDPAGDVTYVSPSSIRQSGFTPEETMCQTLEGTFAPSSRNAARAAIGELYGLIHSGLPVPATPNVYEMLRKDGSTYWGETIYSVVYDEQGEFRQLIGATREVTKRVHAEAQLRAAYQRVQLAADAANIGIWEWNFAEDVLEWDDRMCELYAFPVVARANGLYYDVWRSHLHPDDLDAAEAAFAAALRDSSLVKTHIRIVLPDGVVRHIQAASVIEYDFNGAPARMVGINRDITDQKLYEQLLQDTNAVLEERVAERTADLQTALADLQRAGKLKDEFMAMISHELRTPLTGVLSMSEMLEDQIAGPLNARQATYVKGITQSGERLLAVINGILGYTHLLSGKVQLQTEPCELAHLLGICAASQQYKAAAKGQSIAVQVTPPDLTITADATALAEVLKRLLDNAVKFTPDGGQIGLEAHLGTAPNAGGTPDSVALVVWDTGIGIAAEEQENVFHAFTQADARLARSHEGIGLGLAYVYEMVRLMGGTIALASTPGEGSRFTITLPA